MKKSDQKLLESKLKSLAKPSTIPEPKPDSTDEISTIYGGQVQLPTSPLSAQEQSSEVAKRDTPPAGPPTFPGTTGSLGTTRKSSTTRTSGSTKNTSTTKKIDDSLVAPERDFQRVPNSVTREAMASRMFKGKSKQVWDYLWSVSRGAIIPNRTVRRSRPQIKSGAGLGSMGTVDAALEHLQVVGLISIKTIVGENNGNEYEVFTPEEVAASLFGIPSQTGSTSQSGSTQNLVVPVLPKSGSTSSTLSPIVSTISGQPNTFLNTRETIDDDDAAGFPEVFGMLRKAEKELTGKSSEPKQWEELFELLVAELKIAAARTTVSSVPAFLAEHLRRRLWKMDKRQIKGEAEPTSRSEEQSISAEQVKSCSNCGGTGFYYPKGFEGGVARCRHERFTEGK